MPNYQTGEKKQKKQKKEKKQKNEKHEAKHGKHYKDETHEEKQQKQDKASPETPTARANRKRPIPTWAISLVGLGVTQMLTPPPPGMHPRENWQRLRETIVRMPAT